MIKRPLYNELFSEEYDAKINQTFPEFWRIWWEVYGESNEMFSSILSTTLKTHILI